MKPIEFPGHNVVFAKDQPEYQPLPALRLDNEQGEVISCWELTDEEIESIVKTRCFYLSQYTFGRSLQPILPMAELGDNLNLNLDL